MMYRAEDERLFVFASKAGAPTNPDWYHNLVAHPEVTVEVGTERFTARASVVGGRSGTGSTQRRPAEYPGFAEYQAKTDRVIPVVASTVGRNRSAGHVPRAPLRGRPVRPNIVTVTKSTDTPRCGWCHRPLPQFPGPGRPRRFCSASHRQRAYEARRRADSLQIPAGQVIVSEEDLRSVHDRLYRLETAVEDVEADLAERPAPRRTRRRSSTSSRR